MKKILIINGSPNEHGCTYTALTELQNTLHEEGVETEWLWVGKEKVQGCISCFTCQGRGTCVFDDVVNDLTARLDDFGGIVAGSPVYYGCPSGPLLALLDRFCFVNEKRLARKLAASVVSCRRGGASGAFMALNQCFLNCAMTIVGSEYWNQVHGMKPEDVQEDPEGLQTMRVLGRNMAWLLKCIDAGESAGVPLPKYEERIYTDFVR